MSEFDQFLTRVCADVFGTDAKGQAMTDGFLRKEGFTEGVIVGERLLAPGCPVFLVWDSSRYLMGVFSSEAKAEEWIGSQYEEDEVETGQGYKLERVQLDFERET